MKYKINTNKTRLKTRFVSNKNFYRLETPELSIIKQTKKEEE